MQHESRLLSTASSPFSITLRLDFFHRIGCYIRPRIGMPACTMHGELQGKGTNRSPIKQISAWVNIRLIKANMIRLRASAAHMLSHAFPHEANDR